MIIDYTCLVDRRPRPDILGSELVTNRGPFTNTTGWTAGNSATLTATGGNLYVAYNSVNNPYAYQNVTVEIGELYYTTFSMVSTGAVYNIVIGATDYWVDRSASASETYTAYFVPNSTTATVIVQAILSGGGSILMSSMSIKKVTTLGHGAIQINSASTFDAVTSPWTAINSTLSLSSAKLRITNTGAVYGAAYLVLPTVPGNNYDVSIDYSEQTASSAVLLAETYLNAADLLTLPLGATGTFTDSFVAYGTTTVIRIYNSNENNAYNHFDNITVTQADSGYTIECGASVLSVIDEPQIEQTKTISRRTYSLITAENEEGWDVTTDVFDQEQLADWQEFHASVKGGESFTIDVYQESRPELVTGTTFDSATTGWTGSNATLSIANRRIRVTNSSAVTGSALNSIATVVGQQYRFYVDIIQGTSANASFLIGTTAGNGQVVADTTTQTRTLTGTFIAESTTTHLTLFNNSSTSGHYTDFDNVSVKSTAIDNPQTVELSLGSFKIERVGSMLNYRASFSCRLSV